VHWTIQCPRQIRNDVKIKFWHHARSRAVGVHSVIVVLKMKEERNYGKISQGIPLSAAAIKIAYQPTQTVS